MPKGKSPATLSIALAILVFCVILRVVDVFWIRSDAWFGEQILTKATGLVLILIFAFRCAPIALHHAPARQTARLGMGVPLGVICGVAAGLWAALELAGFSPDFRLSLGAEHGLAMALAMLIGLNMINAVMEEGLFRGVLLSQLTPKLGPLRANISQAMLFGLWHLVWPLRAVVDGDAQPLAALVFGSGYVVVSALIGGYWGWLTQQTRSLWPAIIAHCLNNAALTALTMNSTPELPMIAIFTSLQAVIFLALIPLLRRKFARYP